MQRWSVAGQWTERGGIELVVLGMCQIVKRKRNRKKNNIGFFLLGRLSFCVDCCCCCQVERVGATREGSLEGKLWEGEAT